MLYDIQASLKTYLEQQTGYTCVWIYDGVKMPTAKPFLTIEDIQAENGTLDKMREVVTSTYRFQVGIYANSSAQKAKLSEEIKRIFNFNQIPLLNTSQPGFPTVGYFIADVERIVSMPNDDLTNITNNHRVYLDVYVEVTLYKNE